MTWRDKQYLNTPHRREKQDRYRPNLQPDASNKLTYAGELPSTRKRNDNDWQKTPLGKLILKLVYMSMILTGKLPFPRRNSLEKKADEKAAGED